MVSSISSMEAPLDEVFDEKMIDAMSDDVLDWLHVTAPDEFSDDMVHQLGGLVLMAALAKLNIILPSSLN